MQSMGSTRFSAAAILATVLFNGCFHVYAEASPSNHNTETKCDEKSIKYYLEQEKQMPFRHIFDYTKLGNVCQGHLRIRLPVAQLPPFDTQKIWRSFEVLFEVDPVLGLCVSDIAPVSRTPYSKRCFK